MKDIQNYGVILCCHGSRDKKSVTASLELADKLAELIFPIELKCGFLEFAEPSIPDVLDSMIKAGKTKIDGIPLMLGAAGHVKNDIAWLLRNIASEKGIKTRMTRDLGLDPKMISLANKRIQEAIIKSGKSDVSDCALLVIGRGTSDPDANGDIAKLTRILHEASGFATSLTAYSGVAFPRVDQGLDDLISMNRKTIIVFPYLLFTGRLIDRVYRQCDEAIKANPSTNIIKANYLGGDDIVLSCLQDRLKDIDNDLKNAMNCRLCKYREVIPGHETAKGQAQVAHHFHHQGGSHSH